MHIKNIWDGIVDWIKKNYLFLILFAILIIASNLFFYQFLHQEKYVYFWDWSSYQSKFTFIVEKFQEGIIGPIKDLLYSIRFTDNTFIAPFLISPWGLLFGTSRTVFLFSVLNSFALPAVLMLGVVFIRLTNRRWLYALIPITITLFMPQWWIPLTLGFYDVLTWILICIIWLLMLSDQQDKPYIKAASIGILLTVLIFIRRWLGYWVVSFFIAIFLQWIFSKFKKQTPFWDIKKILLCVIAMIGLFAVISAPIMHEMLTNNYADIFQAYKRGLSSFSVVLKACNYYGWLSLIFVVIGFILAVKDKRIKVFIYIIGIQTLITLFLFAYVQQIDLHHHYQFTIIIILFQALFLFYLWKKQIRNTWKYLLTISFILITFINFLQGLVPQFPFKIQTLNLFADAKHYPLYRNDTQEIIRLINYLDQNTDENSKIYVIASSKIFNDDILSNACLYLSLKNTKVCSQIMQSNHIDLRDGFPEQFLRADYVIIGNPIQYHLKPNDQRVIGVLVEELLNHRSIGKAYQQLPEKFSLDNRVKVKIFKKNRDFKLEELKALQDKFLQFYPEHKKLFEIPLTDNNDSVN